MSQKGPLAWPWGVAQRHSTHERANAGQGGPKEKLEGRIHWAAVYFARTSFQPERKVSVGGREYIVRFSKGESNPDFVDLVKFLEQHKPGGA